MKLNLTLEPLFKYLLFKPQLNLVKLAIYEIESNCFIVKPQVNLVTLVLMVYPGRRARKAALDSPVSQAGQVSKAPEASQERMDLQAHQVRKQNTSWQSRDM